MRRCLRKKLQLEENPAFSVDFLSEKWLLVFPDFDKLLRSQNFRFHQCLRLLLVLCDSCSFFESVKSSDQIWDETYSKSGWFWSATILYPCCYRLKENPRFYSLALFLPVLCRKLTFFVMSKMLSDLWIKLLGNLSDIVLLHFCILAATVWKYIFMIHRFCMIWALLFNQ